MIKCDMHTHTNNSSDCNTPMEDTVKSAIEKGIEVLAFTDHCEWLCFDVKNNYESIKNSLAEADAVQKKYKDKIKILSGIELGEYIYNKNLGDYMLKSLDYDVVIASLHVRRDNTVFSFTDYSKEKEEDIREMLEEYFEDLYELAKVMDYDVLAHLTIPYRYINGKYGHNFDSREYEKIITKILKTVIKREKALEINTSGVKTFGMLFPDEWIVEKYYDLGGRIITIGADAHTPENVASGFDEVEKYLKEVGFTGYYYFEKRNKVFVEF